MNQEVKTKWLEALRSGEYKQGRSFLHKNGSFCCLGVLCDLYAKEKPTHGKWESVDGDDIMGFRTMETGPTNKVYLPLEVADWAGLSDINPAILNGMKLSTMNDMGDGFEKIAKAIENKL